MKVTLQKPARAKAPWLRVFRASGLCEEVQAADRGTDGQDRAEQDRAEQDRAEQDRAEQDRAEAEMFWAGRIPAMRHSARVAA